MSTRRADKNVGGTENKMTQKWVFFICIFKVSNSSMLKFCNYLMVQ